MDGGTENLEMRDQKIKKHTNQSSQAHLSNIYIYKSDHPS